MKNAVGLIDALKGHYDFAINEECHEWKECDVSASKIAPISTSLPPRPTHSLTQLTELHPNHSSLARSNRPTVLPSHTRFIYRYTRRRS